jgi:cytochrome c5
MSKPASKFGSRLCAALVVASPALAFAGEEQIKLKEGPGRETVQANCVMCHSLDYIPMNSPFMKRANWQASVDKMLKVMGAPIRQDDVPVIVDYLTRYYGVE